MTRIGRPPKAYRTVQWCFRLPEHLAGRFDLLLADPTTNSIPPNARQELFIPLLERLWQAMLVDDQSIDISDIVATLRSRFQLGDQL